MIIKNNSVEYRLCFKYAKTENGRRSIACKIEEVETGKKFNEDGKTIGTGESICDTRDKFVKATGRKIALKRAMACISKEDRTVIWKAYTNKANV